jgi:hypothetical protein
MGAPKKLRIESELHIIFWEIPSMPLQILFIAKSLILYVSLCYKINLIYVIHVTFSITFFQNDNIAHVFNL